MENNQLNTTINIHPVKQQLLEEIQSKSNELSILESNYTTPNRVKRTYNSKPKVVFDDTMYAMIAGYVYVGYTQNEIAKRLNINISTLKSCIKRDEKLRLIIEQNKKFTDGIAMGGLLKLMIEDNPQAIFFYMKNRMDEFKDKAELTLKGNDVDRPKVFEKIKEVTGLK